MNLNDLRRALADRATEGEPLSRHTTFAIGGPADLFVEAHAQDELRTYAQLAWQHRVPYLVLGGGSNVLVADSGIRGLVIHNQCRALEVVPGADHAWLVRAESGAEMREVARQSMSHALSGLEWSVDVPGTVGGAVVGNAGAFGGYVSDSLRGAMVFSPDEEARWWPASELELNYRSSVFKKRFLGEPWSPVILTATFALSSEDATLIGERAAEYKVRRAETQPRGLSAGSVFKRSEQYPAGFLIENAGLKGKQVGEAIISSQHANFIINLGTATACDVRDLMVSIQEAVAREFGVTLEPEIELVGDW